MIKSQLITPPVYQVANHQRIIWIDALRGFVMINVVLMHIWNTLPMEIQHNYYFQTLESFVTMYYLPIFFFISGLFSNKNYTLSKIVKKCMPWILGAVVFASLFILYKNQFYFRQISNSSLYRCYWFTIALTQMFLLSQLIFRTGRLSLLLLGIVSIFLFCMVIVLDDLEPKPIISDILAWRETCFYFAFFSIGIMVGKLRPKFIKVLSSTKYCGVGVVLFIVLFILRGMTSGNIESMCSYLCRYPAIFITVALFYKFQLFFNENKLGNLLAFIGRRTLDIYFLHYFFLPETLPLGLLFYNGNIMAMMVLVGGVLATIVIALALFCSSFIRLCPGFTKFLLGK